MWIKLLNDYTKIKSIFHTEPKLTNVLLKKITFNEFIPDISINIDLNDFPESPPSKWIQAKYNTIDIELKLISVTNINLKNWNGLHRVDIDLSGTRNESISISIIGDDFRLTGKANFIDITKISAYKNIS